MRLKLRNVRNILQFSLDQSKWWNGKYQRLVPWLESILGRTNFCGDINYLKQSTDPIIKVSDRVATIFTSGCAY